ncbi:MAG TPA: hypothetical protein VGN78_06680, partial [Solirubrobacteraceae bacterium]|nr:hypothetical protein [Solirubrobacteraceae bacterium]
QLNRPIHHRDAKDWGLLGWARPILDVVFDGVSDTIDYELEQLLGPERHVRLQIELVGASDNMDDATPENIANLERKAQELIVEHDEEIARVCAALVG